MKKLLIILISTYTIFNNNLYACHDINFDLFVNCTDTPNQYEINLYICLGNNQGVIADKTCGIQLFVHGATILNHPNSLFLGDTHNIQLNSTDLQKLVYGTPDCSGDEVFWNAGIVASNCIGDDSNTDNIKVLVEGYPNSIEIKGLEENECNELLFIPPMTSISFNNVDTLICEGDSVVLDVGQDNMNTQYKWQDGSILPTFTTKETGSYWAVIDNGCETDTFIANIEVKPLPHFDLLIDTAICENQTAQISINSPHAESFVWSNGSNSNSTPIDTEGIYTVTAQNSCGLVTDSIQVTLEPCQSIVFPTAFSPNGDGINDSFSPVQSSEISDYTLLIYDRWGVLVFSTKDTQQAWDGTSLKGNFLDMGTYVWVASYTKHRSDGKTKPAQLKGNVTIIY